MNRIGIMQGRLLPPAADRVQAFPRDHWDQEFGLAREAGLKCIEWIYDAFGQDINPIGSDLGVEKMLHLQEDSGIAVRSLCADYLMDCPLLRASTSEIDQRLAHLKWLLGRCRRVGIRRVVLPFVDHSAIKSDEEANSLTRLLLVLAGAARDSEVELHLETDLAPAPFARFLAPLQSDVFFVNYDSGNSAALGYLPRDEFAAYGDRIGSVHIKDRRRGGTTVPLGTGDADLEMVFKCLRVRNHAGDLILQVARGIPGEEVEWARRNRDFVAQYLERWISA